MGESTRRVADSHDPLRLFIGGENSRYLPDYVHYPLQRVRVKDLHKQPKNSFSDKDLFQIIYFRKFTYVDFQWA